MASRSWNKVELIGNLTRDPELRYTPNGAAVASFSVATNRSYVADGERKEEVDFHRCVAWNKLAEICSQMLKKGSKVFVSGRIQNRSWEDQTSGQTRYITEIVVEDMIVLTSRGAEGEYTPPTGAEMAEEPVPARQADDMPKESGKGKAESVKEVKKTDKEQPVAEKPIKETVEDLDDLPF